MRGGCGGSARRDLARRDSAQPGPEPASEGPAQARSGPPAGGRTDEDGDGMEDPVTILREPARWSLAELSRLAVGPLEAAGALRAVVFGSYARGVADAWSDLDLAVVIDTGLPKLERSRLLEDLHDAVPVPLDLLIYTPSEFERGSAAGLDVFAAIATEGKTIFPAEGEPG